MGTYTEISNPSQLSSNAAPLAALDKGGYEHTNFTYPLNLDGINAGQNHYMVFHINEQANTQYQTSAGGQTSQLSSTPLSPVGGNSTAATNAANAKSQGFGSTALTPSSVPQPDQGSEATSDSGGTAEQPDLDSILSGTQRVVTTIVLYMPQDIQTSYTADWERTELGLAEDFVGKFRGSTSWTDLKNSLGDSLAQNVGTMLNNATNMNLKDATSAATHLVINNHLEVIFNGIGFRQFTFSWRFTPTSEAEGQNINNIIQAFKFYAAPEILKNTAGRFWIYPATFDIQYYAFGQENLLLNKISTCALTNIQVNYTATGHWAAHRYNNKLQGSQSVCTDMTLTFMELELMTKDRILSGY